MFCFCGIFGWFRRYRIGAGIGIWYREQEWAAKQHLCGAMDRWKHPGMCGRTVQREGRFALFPIRGIGAICSTPDFDERSESPKLWLSISRAEMSAGEGRICAWRKAIFQTCLINMQPCWLFLRPVSVRDTFIGALKRIFRNCGINMANKASR